ncbi:MAG: hypothetical protein ABSG15_07640 [FCB group bacterium]|jgi:hypothetical protein
MKKSTKLSEAISKGSKIVIATSLLSAPMLLHSTPLLSKSGNIPLEQFDASSKSISTQKMVKIIKWIKNSNSYSIVGLDNSHTIYKNAKGEYFYLEPNTGDMKFLSKDVFMKFTTFIKSNGKIIKMQKFAENDVNHKWNKNIKWYSVTIVGIDNKGNVIQQNSKGEKFYLDPITGDMIFVKID